MTDAASLPAEPPRPPAAFTVATGRDHWHLLQRARGDGLLGRARVGRQRQEEGIGCGPHGGGEHAGLAGKGELVGVARQVQGKLAYRRQ